MSERLNPVVELSDGTEATLYQAGCGRYRSTDNREDRELVFRGFWVFMNDFRQTEFADYELKVHETAENNQPLTGDVLTDLYAEILRRYYVMMRA